MLPSGVLRCKLRGPPPPPPAPAAAASSTSPAPPSWALGGGERLSPAAFSWSDTRGPRRGTSKAHRVNRCA
ncbi:unnamed protein product [Lampetra planeri]